MYSEKQKKLITEELEFQSGRQLHAAYDDSLDDVFGRAEIAGGSYATSYALKNLDPVTYRCGFADWLDAEISDGVYSEEINGQHYLQSEVDDLLESTKEGVE
jgi:hypothetical protein